MQIKSSQTGTDQLGVDAISLHTKDRLPSKCIKPMVFDSVTVSVLDTGIGISLSTLKVSLSLLLENVRFMHSGLVWGWLF